MGKLKLTKKELKKLENAHSDVMKNKKAIYSYRILTIILLGEMKSFRKVASTLRLHEDTVRTYANQYQSDGIKGLLGDKYVPYSGKLTNNEITELSIHLEENTYRTVEEILRYVQKAYDIAYSISGMTTLLHNIGFVYKKPKKIPGKADIAKQKAFIKEYKAIKSDLKEEDSMYFLDATHPNHSTVATYGWIKKGMDKPINSTVSRQRLNIHGALNIDDFSVVVRYEESLNKGSATEILFDLRQKQPKGKIYTVVDNASYYQNQTFKKYAKKLGITPLYLPSYSPNLNLIERLWLFFQKKTIYNKFYKTFSDFKNSTKSFFKNIDRYQYELSSLLTENFNIISLQNT